MKKLTGEIMEFADSIVIALVAVMVVSVSYTHLDVYKRQALYQSCNRRNRKPADQ